jgi:hypothetical protein
MGFLHCLIVDNNFRKYEKRANVHSRALTQLCKKPIYSFLNQLHLKAGNLCSLLCGEMLYWKGEKHPKNAKTDHDEQMDKAASCRSVQCVSIFEKLVYQ